MNETTYKVGAAYPDDVLQDIAHELVVLHTFTTMPLAVGLDPRPSAQLWTEVEYFLLYIAECAIRASGRLHPSSQSRLTHLLIEEWIASNKSIPNPSSGIVARTAVSLVLKTGIDEKLRRDRYGKFRTAWDEFLESPYRKIELKESDNLNALTGHFLGNNIRGASGQAWTFTEFESAGTQIFDYYNNAMRCIWNRAY